MRLGLLLVSMLKRKCPPLSMNRHLQRWDLLLIPVGQGVTESPRISPLDVRLELEGGSAPLCFFAFSPAICSARGGVAPPQFHFSSSAIVPGGFHLVPEPTTDFFLMVCMPCYRK